MCGNRLRQSAPCSVTCLAQRSSNRLLNLWVARSTAAMSAGTITLATPLAPGASINLQFLLGVQQTGSFKFFFNIEALP